MATAPTSLRTTAGDLCLGSAPDSWGVWFPEDDRQVPYTRFLDELVAAGDGTLARLRQVAELTAAAGAHHLALVPPMYRDEKTGAFTESPELTAGQWAGFGKAADRLGELLLDEYDLRLVIHPHADSHIQTQPEIERLPGESDERVGYVHIKRMDPEILVQVAAENLSFGEAVQRGVCVSPPAGVPKPADVVAELARLEAELFVIVEQDLYPRAPDAPLPIAVRTREHLAGCGLSGTQCPAPTTADR
ncbi:2-keto-myo-inositol dehydratase [Streptomyces sp. NPDC057623]|uniref:2-keto-myo-inositol dehydratase n=1 Tax=Streptomyces sp. NPDC057623 TaxID=3346187 RepID=UPI0036AA25F8